MSFLDDGFDLGDAMFAGTAYAMFRHGQDRQTAQLVEALAGQQQITVNVNVNTAEEEEPGVVINALDYTTAMMPQGWDDYIGQEPMKRQIAVYMKSAQQRGARFPHTLLASGYPGVGKTTLARLIAKTMGVRIIELVPPFNMATLVDALMSLSDHDVLFIDEIHKLADSGKRGAEMLLKILEDGVAFMPNGDVWEFNDVTIIGATTDRDKLPEPVIDRFKVKPYFQPYSINELILIACQFAGRHNAVEAVNNDVVITAAYACRGTPRIAEEMILAARDLGFALGRIPTGKELLDFIEVEDDGITRQHIQYLTSMRQFFPRTLRDSEEVEYIAGEAAMMQLLRETKPGIARVENFLVERGLIDRTPRGRRLTSAGVQRAEQFIREGKGASSA
jgi:Holliday junction DNA helicase RuvB